MKSMDAGEVKKLSKKATLEQKFLATWRLVAGAAGLPDPVMQHRFHAQRKWRFDFSWPEYRLAVEIDGGSFVRGGHNTALGQNKDYEKSNEATRMGWRVLRFNTVAMKDPVSVVEFVMEVMTNAREVST